MNTRDATYLAALGDAVHVLGERGLAAARKGDEYLEGPEADLQLLDAWDAIERIATRWCSHKPITTVTPPLLRDLISAVRESLRRTDGFGNHQVVGAAMALTQHEAQVIALCGGGLTRDDAETALALGWRTPAASTPRTPKPTEDEAPSC